jgi:hypothetical protein
MRSPPNQQLSAQDLLAGSGITHAIEVDERILRPGPAANGGCAGTVRLRPLSVGILALISRAAREDEGLVPLLMIKEALVDPAVSLDQVRQMHIGLVHFLVRQINVISGLGPDGDALDSVASSPLAASHLLLAKHFGWTPEQVSQLTPAQVAVYLRGIETLVNWDRSAGRSE